MTGRRGPRVLCVAGESGSGKTTLIRRLVGRLPVPPHRMGLVKHTHHPIDWHPAGKDSGVLWDRGPAALGVAGPDQTALFLRHDVDPHAGPGRPDATRRLIGTCRRLPGDLELVLAEGFEGADAPTLWMAGPTVEDPAVPGLRAVAATAEERGAWEAHGPDVPVLVRDDVDVLAARVMEWAVPLEELPIG